MRNIRLSLLRTTALGYAPLPATLAVAPMADSQQDPPGSLATEMEKRSPDSAKMFIYWDKVDAILDGLEGMKDRGKTFMPMFGEETADEYAFRREYCKFTNVYRDIVEGLASKPFEQAVQLIDDQTDATKDSAPGTGIPQAIVDFQWDVDGSGNNLSVFAAQTFFNGINYAIDWIMVDHAPLNPAIRSIKDAKDAGLRPYWTHVLGRNILDVQSAVIGGDEVLTYVKIHEPGEPDHIREFIRHPRDGDTGHWVEWRLWKKVDQKYTPVGAGQITIGVIPMVPFVTGRRDGRRWRFDPPMRAAAELQINLFRQESALEWTCVLTAYPMLAANGISPPMGQDGKPNTKMVVGPNRTLWSAPSVETGRSGHWEYVQPGSETLKFLQDRIDKTIQDLRELGRQPLTASSSNITVITAAVAAGKAKSAVKAWAHMLKDTIENALAMTAMWLGIDYDPTVHVYAEFDDWMEGEDLNALLTMRETGDLTRETLFEEMQRRGVLSSNFTPAREEKRALAEIPREGPDMDTTGDNAP